MAPVSGRRRRRGARAATGRGGRAAARPAGTGRRVAGVRLPVRAVPTVVSRVPFLTFRRVPGRAVGAPSRTRARRARGALPGAVRRAVAAVRARTADGGAAAVRADGHAAAGDGEDQRRHGGAAEDGTETGGGWHGGLRAATRRRAGALFNPATRPRVTPRASSKRPGPARPSRCRYA